MGVQSGWAACPKCQGLFFGPFRGRCPADNREHGEAHSFLYEISFDVPANDHLQTGWRSCPKCQGMHFAGFPFKGVCPAGGPHEQTNSFAYALMHDVAAAEFVQPGWRACPKCQGLFFGQFRGRCPADGREHSAENSFNYALRFLVRPINPALRLVDHVTNVEVIGNGFTRDSTVNISFTFFTVTDVSQQHLVASADGDGNFSGVTFDLDKPHPFNITVQARDIVTGQEVIAPVLRPQV